MADAEKVIRVRIDASGAVAGAQQVNNAVAGMGKNAAANDNVTSSLKRMKDELGNTGKAGGVAAKAMDEIRGKSAGAIPVVGQLISSLTRMGPVATIIGTVVLALGAVGVAAVRAAAQVEVWKANLLTVTKSSQIAQSAYAGLVNFANKTPFTLEQSVTGFIKLRALGLATSEAIMTSYGNTASAMGKNMSQMIEAVADATTGEFERLKEFGIKAKQSGDSVAFTFQGVTTKVKKNAKEIQDYIVGIGTKNFGGAMARQAATVSGAFSQLGDQIFNTFAAMGDGELAKAVSGFTSMLTSGLANITPLLSGIADVIGSIIGFFVSLVSGATSGFGAVVAGAAGSYGPIEKISVALTFVGETIGVLGAIFGQVFGAIGGIIGETVDFIGTQFGAVFDWLMPATENTGQSMGESFVGVLRAAQFVAGQLPNIFKAALAELKLAFIQTGAALSASLTGDFSKWGNVDLSFSKTKETIASTWKGAQATYGNQKANRAWIDKAAGRGDKGNLDFKALGEGKSDPKGGGDKAKKDAEDKLKKERDFWKTLEGEVETAKRFGLEADKYTKTQELQKLLGRDINAAEKERLATLLQQKATTEALTKLDQTILQNNQRDWAKNPTGIEGEIVVTGRRATSSADLEVENELLEMRVKFIESATTAEQAMAMLNSVELKAREDILRTQIKQRREDDMRSDAVMRIKKALETNGDWAGKTVAGHQLAQTIRGGENGSLDQQVKAATREIDTNLNGMKTAVEEMHLNSKYTQEEIAQIEADILTLEQERANIVAATTQKMVTTLLDSTKKLGGQFRQMFGDKIGGGLAGLTELGGMFASLKSGGGLEALGANATSQVGQTLNGIKDVSSNLGKLFGGENSKFFQGLSSTLGKAAGGAEMGSAVAGMGKMLWSKFSSTGAQIGGAIGSFAGPLGSLAGSIIGGVLGGLFKKTKYGTATIVNGKVTTAGNSDQYKDNASSAGNSITSSISKIADQFGTDIGNYSVSIGQYDGKWRVSPGGKTGKLKGGDVKDFGKEGAEAALRYAIQDAIKDGALMGLRASTNALLKAGDDIEAQLEKAMKFEQVFKDLKSYINPVGAALDTLGLEMKSLTKIFNEAGATSEEYGQLEQLRSLKIKDIIASQAKGLQELLDGLNGDGGGASAMTQLTRELSQLEQFRSDIGAGKTINQDAYTSLVDQIMGHSTSLYGANSAENQSIVADLKALTAGAITNVESAANAAIEANGLDSALRAQTDVISQIGQQQLDTLGKIFDALRAGQTVIRATHGPLNGRIVALVP